MKKIFIGLLALIVIYFVGPKPNAPVLNASPTWTQIPDSMPQISEFIQQKELANKELKLGLFSKGKNYFNNVLEQGSYNTLVGN